MPKAGQEVVEKAVAAAVESGSVWLLSGPASVLGEPIPAGVLTSAATLSTPPAPIGAAEILPENLPSAWQGEESNALAVATGLSQKAGKTLPKLLDIKAKSKVPIAFTVRVEIGDGQELPASGVVGQVNEIRNDVKDGFEART